MACVSEAALEQPPGVGCNHVGRSGGLPVVQDCRDGVSLPELRAQQRSIEGVQAVARVEQ